MRILSIEQKHWIFLAVVILTTLYVFEPTSGSVSQIINYNVRIAPFISIKNLFILILIYMWWKIFIAGR